MSVIAHIADVHFGREDKVALAAAAAMIADAKPDILVVAGDVTQRGKRREFAAAREWLFQFRMPKLVVAGNHDTPLLNIPLRVSAPFERFEKYFGSHSFIARTSDIAVSGLNTARGWQARRNWAEGSVSLSRLDDSIMRMGEAGSKVLKVLACHHPFLSPPGAPLRISTKRGDAASRRVAGSGVSLVLTGHVHTPSAILREERRGHYLAVTCGTLSRRLREAPPSFNLITVTADTMQVDSCVLEGETMQRHDLGTFPR